MKYILTLLLALYLSGCGLTNMGAWAQRCNELEFEDDYQQCMAEYHAEKDRRIRIFSSGIGSIGSGLQATTYQRPKQTNCTTNYWGGTGHTSCTEY